MQAFYLDVISYIHTPPYLQVNSQIISYLWKQPLFYLPFFKMFGYIQLKKNQSKIRPNLVMVNIIRNIYEDWKYKKVGYFSHQIRSPFFGIIMNSVTSISNSVKKNQIRSRFDPEKTNLVQIRPKKFKFGQYQFLLYPCFFYIRARPIILRSTVI